MSNQYLQGIREALTRNATKTSVSNLEKQGLQSVRVIRAGRILELIQESVDRHLNALGIDATEEERQNLVEKSHSTFGNLMSAESSDDALRNALERAAHLEGEIFEAHKQRESLAEEIEGLKASGGETGPPSEEMEKLQQRIGALTAERDAAIKRAEVAETSLAEAQASQQKTEDAYRTLQQSFEALSQEHDEAVDLEDLHQIKTQLDSVSLELKGARDEKEALEQQCRRWREDPLSVTEVADVLTNAREELEELTQKFEEVQKERDEFQQQIESSSIQHREVEELRESLQRTHQERDELLQKQSGLADFQTENEKLTSRCQALDDECRELRVRLDEARQSTARLEEREQSLREEGEQLKAHAAAESERSVEVIHSLFDEIKGLKESLASGELVASSAPQAAPSSGDSQALANLTKDLADRIDKIGKKVGVNAVEEQDVSLDAIFSNQLKTDLDSNITNVKVTERKSESGSSVSDALQRMKKLKKGG